MKVEIENKTDFDIAPLRLERLLNVAQKTMRLPKEAALQLFFVSVKEIRQLNKRTRKIDRATDVLSFPVQTGRSLEKDAEGNISLGDVVICPEYALKNAVKEGRKKEEELRFLAVHGLLHLCGYDHADTEEQNKMDEMSDKIFANFFKQ